MPRPDNKRQKQGRPSDPRATVFQEQFTPQMPGSAQRDVFINPTAERRDTQSQISFGNMVQGPDSGLQTLAAVAQGITRGAQAAQQVYKYRVDKGQKDFDQMMMEEEYGKVVYKPTEGPMPIDPETGEPIPRTQEPLLINKKDPEYAELVKDYEDARANGTLDELEYTIVDDPQANYTMLRDKMESFLDGRPREVRLYANRALEKYDSAAYAADQKDRTKDLIREASAIRNPEDRLAFLEDYRDQHGAYEGEMVGDQWNQLYTQTNHALSTDHERQIQTKLIDSIDELVRKADADGTILDLDPEVVNDLIEPIIQEVLGSDNVTEADLDKLAKLQEIKENGMREINKAQRRFVHEVQKENRLNDEKRAEISFDSLNPEQKLFSLDDELDRREAIRERAGPQGKTKRAARRAEDVLDIFRGMTDQFAKNSQSLIEFARKNGITGTENMSANAIIKRVQALFSARLKGAQLTPEIREEILQEEAAQVQADINRILSEKAASGNGYLSKDSQEELGYLQKTLQFIKENPEEALVQIVTSAPSKYDAFRDDFDYQEEQLLSLFPPEVIDDITSDIVTNRQANTLEFAMTAIAVEAADPANAGRVSLTDYDTDTILFGPLSPSGMSLEMFDINPELKDAAIEVMEAIRNGTVDEPDIDGKTPRQRYDEMFTDIYPERSTDDPLAAAGLEVAGDVLQQFDQAKVDQYNKTSSDRRAKNKEIENGTKWNAAVKDMQITGQPVKIDPDNPDSQAELEAAMAYGVYLQQTTSDMVFSDPGIIETYPLAKALMAYSKLPETERGSLTEYFLQWAQDNNENIDMNDIEAVQIVIDPNIAVNGIPRFTDSKIRDSKVASDMLSVLYGRMLGQDRVVSDGIELTNPYTGEQQTFTYRLSSDLMKQMREDLQQEIGEIAADVGRPNITQVRTLHERNTNIQSYAYAEGIVEKARQDSRTGLTPDEEAAIRLDARNDYKNGLIFESRDADDIQAMLGYSDEQIAFGRVMSHLAPPGSPIPDSLVDLVFNAQLGNTDFEPSVTRGRELVAELQPYFESEDYRGGLYHLIAQIHGAADLSQVYRDNTYGTSTVDEALNAVIASAEGETEDEQAESLLRSILAGGSSTHGRIGTLERIMSQAFEGGAGNQKQIPPADIIRFLKAPRLLENGRSQMFTANGQAHVAGEHKDHTLSGGRRNAEKVSIPAEAGMLFGSRIHAPAAWIGLTINNRDNYTMSAETKSQINDDLANLAKTNPALISELQVLPTALLAVWTDAWVKENYGDQVVNAGNLSDAMQLGASQYMPLTFEDTAIGGPDPLIEDALEGLDMLPRQTRIPSIAAVRNTLMFGRMLGPDQQREPFTTGDSREIRLSVGQDSITRGNEVFTAVDFGNTVFSIPTSNEMIEFNPEAVDLVAARVDRSIRTTGDLASDNPRIFMGPDNRRSIDVTYLRANPELIPETIRREEVQTARDIVAELENANILVNKNGVYSIPKYFWLPPDPINGQMYSQRAFLDDRAYNPGIKMLFLRALATPETEEVEELVDTYSTGPFGGERGAIPGQRTAILNPFGTGTLGRQVATPQMRQGIDASVYGEFRTFSDSLQRPEYEVQVGTVSAKGGNLIAKSSPPIFPELLTETADFVNDIADSIGEFFTGKEFNRTEEVRNNVYRRAGDDPKTGGLTMDSYIPYLDMTIREAIDLSRRVN